MKLLVIAAKLLSYRQQIVEWQRRPKSPKSAGKSPKFQNWVESLKFLRPNFYVTTSSFLISEWAQKSWTKWEAGSQKLWRSFWLCLASWEPCIWFTFRLQFVKHPTVTRKKMLKTQNKLCSKYRLSGSWLTVIECGLCVSEISLIEMLTNWNSWLLKVWNANSRELWNAQTITIWCCSSDFEQSRRDFFGIPIIEIPCGDNL